MFFEEVKSKFIQFNAFSLMTVIVWIDILSWKIKIYSIFWN